MAGHLDLLHSREQIYGVIMIKRTEWRPASPERKSDYERRRECDAQSRERERERELERAWRVRM